MMKMFPGSGFTMQDTGPLVVTVYRAGSVGVHVTSLHGTDERETAKWDADTDRNPQDRPNVAQEFLIGAGGILREVDWR